MFFKGRVTDSSTNQPIAFANIMQKGTRNATMADADGYFNLKINRTETDGEVHLVFSSIEYDQKELILTEASDQLSVQLKPRVIMVTVGAVVIVKKRKKWWRRIWKKW